MHRADMNDAPLEPAPARFGHAPPRVGEALVERGSLTMAADVHIDGRAAFTMGLETLAERTRTVIAAQDAGGVELLLAYGDVTRRSWRRRARQDVREPISGRTYRVLLDGAGGLRAFRGDGTEASPEELARIRRDGFGLGDERLVASIVPDGDVAPDTALPLHVADAARFFGLAAAMTVTAVDVRYLGLRPAAHDDGAGRIAALGVTLGIAGAPSEGLTMQATLTGTIDVALATSERVAASLTGPLVLEGGRRMAVIGAGMSGTGTLTLSSTSTPASG
jgi:hypothetical protein